MPPNLFKNHARSIAFAKPASCDLFRRRTSMTRFTPCAKSRSKKASAVVSVKPIVNTCVKLSSNLSTYSIDAVDLQIAAPIDAGEQTR
jgi:hypothetical protein